MFWLLEHLPKCTCPFSNTPRIYQGLDSAEAEPCIVGFPNGGSWRCDIISFMRLFYFCDPPCQMVSNAKERRFACLEFPSLNFDYSSFDFFAQNHKKIDVPLEPWKGSTMQSPKLPWLSVPSSQGGQTLSSRSRLKDVTAEPSLTGCSSAGLHKPQPAPTLIAPGRNTTEQHDASPSPEQALPWETPVLFFICTT